MNKVFYSLSGEGLGHSSRVYSIIEEAKDIEFHVFTWGEAYDFFKNLNYPNLHKITSIHFGRDSKNRVSLPGTIWNFLKLLWNCPNDILNILRLADQLKPDLFISDFEPILPRAAHLGGYKLISIDNQHRFSRCSSEGMDWFLKLYCFITGLFVEFWVPFPSKTIISTFNHEKIKKEGKCILVNTFLRKIFEEITPSKGEYLLVYYKKSMNKNILDILEKMDIKVKIYGCPHKGYRFEYHEIAYDDFVKDLAGCRAIIAGSGNQLLGEANYYGKPVFAIPEPRQYEQYVNGYFLEKMKKGVCVLNEKLKEKDVLDFLNNFKNNEKQGKNGVYKVVEEIRKSINEKP